MRGTKSERWATTRLDNERGGRVMDFKVYGLWNLPWNGAVLRLFYHAMPSQNLCQEFSFRED